MGSSDSTLRLSSDSVARGRDLTITVDCHVSDPSVLEDTITFQLIGTQCTHQGRWAYKIGAKNNAGIGPTESYVDTRTDCDQQFERTIRQPVQWTQGQHSISATISVPVHAPISTEGPSAEERTTFPYHYTEWTKSHVWYEYKVHVTVAKKGWYRRDMRLERSVSVV